MPICTPYCDPHLRFTGKKSAMSLSSTVQSLSILCCIALILAVLPQVYAGLLFPWHPILMGVGFLGFMCEGIVAAYKLRATDGPPRVAALQNHMWVQIAATLSIALGFAAIFYNKVRGMEECLLEVGALERVVLHPILTAAPSPLSLPPLSPSRPNKLQSLHGKTHFKSLHGKLGLITTILVGATPALGFFSFRKLGLLAQLPSEWQPAVKWAHRLLGASTWTLALVTMQLPLPHSAVMEGLACRAWQAASAVLGVAVLLMLRRPPPGKPVLPQVDFTMVPRGPKHL